MAKVLYIKANIKGDGESRTFKISDKFVEKYKETHPEDEVVTLDLYKEGIDFLPPGKLGELHVTEEGYGKDHPILKYAYQFLEADKYIFAAPFWNLSFPAIVKAYIDYITTAGITFKYTAQGAVGLCKGKAVHIVARGGEYLDGPAVHFEMGDRYLKTILTFLGVTSYETISADGLDVIGNDVEGILSKAIERAEDYAAQF